MQLYAKKFPETLSKVVLLDVGKSGNSFSLSSAKNDLLMFMYTSWLATGFIISRISTRLAAFWISLYPWTSIGPCPYEKEKPASFDALPFMCYMYFQFYLGIFSLSHQLNENMSNTSRLPIQYLYGGKKRVMFHDASYIEYLQNRSDCRCKCFENEGHWLHWSSSNTVAKEIQDFLLH